MLRYILHNENWQQPHTWNTEEEWHRMPLFFSTIWGCTNSLKGNQNQYCRLLPTLANLNQYISCLLLAYNQKHSPSLSFISFVIRENSWKPHKSTSVATFLILIWAREYDALNVAASSQHFIPLLMSSAHNFYFFWLYVVCVFYTQTKKG